MHTFNIDLISLTSDKQIFTQKKNLNYILQYGTCKI